MKRVVALALALIMACGILVGCKNDNTDKGAIIPINLTSERFNVDPGRVFYDAEAMKLSGLLFEGLTRLTEDGKVEKALAKNWTTRIDEKKGEYILNIELNKTWWSDGRQVIAEHVVYAWKRALDPASNNPAASLLYDIKNARKVKSGEMTVDDIGLAAPEDFIVEVEFEGPFDADEFMKRVASPALVPLREDVVSKNPTTWATRIDTVVTNGPFTIKKMGGAEAVEGEEGEEGEEAGESESSGSAQSAAQEALTAERIAIPATLDDYKVVAIGRNAFKDCCVPEIIIIPEGVTSIGREAFAGCTALEQVVIPSTVETIDRGAFKMCSKLKTITIPESVKAIEKETFFACGMLNNVVIPETVEEIAKGAFTGCDSLVITGVRGSVAEEYATDNEIIFQVYQSFIQRYGTVILIIAGVILLIVLIIVTVILVKRAKKAAFKKEIAEQKAAREAKYGKRRPEDNI